MEFEASDVIRLIQQYLKENNLLDSLHALEKETGVCLNTVDSIESFKLDIVNGRWDNVLAELRNLRLNNSNLVDVYEQIVIELIEYREIGAARTLLKQTEPMQFMKVNQPQRYSRLENLLLRSHFDAKEAYTNGVSKEKKREIIANELISHVSIAPPSRLLCLLGQALKFQKNQSLLPPGSSIDIFHGKIHNVASEQEMHPTVHKMTIKLGSKSNPESIVFSPDAQYFVTGSSDGFIEVWNYLTGKLRRDLKYQAEERFMVMNGAVTCLAFSEDSEMLASGSDSGDIRVWKIQTGQCLRKLDNAHSKGVTSVGFSKDSSQILSSSFDCTSRLFGLKSGKLLKEFRGHLSFVNCAIFTNNDHSIISASSDGTIKTWNVRGSQEAVATFQTLGSQFSATVVDVPVNCVHLYPKSILGSNVDNVVVCNRSSSISIMNLQGQILKTFATAQQTQVEFNCSCVSPRGNWIYTVGDDNILYCFSTDTGELEHALSVHTKQVIGIAHHPFQNIVATFSKDGTVLFWRA